jgi:K+-transporting ATPase ATPase A chain
MVSLLRDDPFELQPAHLLIKGPAAPDLVTRVFAGDWTPLSPLLRPAERLVYWCCGVDETEEQSWRAYAVSMLFFGVAGFITLYALQRLRSYLPFNPQGQAGAEQVLPSTRR